MTISMSLIDEMAYSFFEGCDFDTTNVTETRDCPLSVAQGFVDAFYPSSLCSYIFGSSLIGRFSRFSDIDIVIINDIVPSGGVSRRVFRGYPIEAHVFSEKAALLAFRVAMASGRNNVMLSIAEGEIIRDASGLGVRLRATADSIISNPPHPPSYEVVSSLYCRVICFLVSISRSESYDERFADIALLHSVIMELYCATNRLWFKSRRWAIIDHPVFSSQLHQALKQSLDTGDVTDIARLLQRLPIVWKSMRWSCGFKAQ